ncbi:MAG: glycosyltransferase family 2 protein [Planctomycetia bacterium]|nr:glycosyltransferase family 2 protein [Planctomycetia bacterium]
MKTDQSLTVSVAMCTYNGARFLLEQLESFAKQTRLPNEVVVCDDGSTDNTLEILEKWAKNAPFEVKIVQNEKNLGYSKNFEKALSLCAGDVIFLSDQDDVWLPTKIENMTNVFMKNPNISVVYCEGQVIDGDGKEHDLTYSQILLPRLNCSEVYYLTPNYKLGKSYAGCCSAVRKSVLNRILPIPEGFTHDRWIFFTVPVIAEVHFCEEILIHYRIHSSNATQGQIIHNAMKLDMVRHFYRNATDNYFFIEPKIKTLRQWIIEQENTLKTSKTRYVLRWLHKNDSHFTNRSRIQRNAFKFFPLWVWEVISFHYFQRNQSLHAVFYDIFCGIFRWKK